LLGKENLLDANQSTRTVVGGIAVEQALVTIPVAIAVARLLREHLGHLACELIGSRYQRSIGEIGSGQ
jgi:hypothetical protein